MSEYRAGQVIDAVVAAVGVLPGFRLIDDPGPGIGAVTVWDGPEWQISEDHADGGHLVIGWSGARDERSPSAESTWSSGPIAASVRPREETATIRCLAVSQNKDTAKEARDEVVTLLSAVAQACRAAPALGIDTSTTVGGVSTLAFVTAGSLTQYAYRGFTAELEFTITYKTRV